MLDVTEIFIPVIPSVAHQWFSEDKCARLDIPNTALTISPIPHGLFCNVMLTLCPLRGETCSFPFNLCGFVTRKKVPLIYFQDKIIKGDTCLGLLGGSLLEHSHHAVRKPNCHKDLLCVSDPAKSLSRGPSSYNHVKEVAIDSSLQITSMSSQIS